jgi:L-arabinose isomerase
MFSHDGHGNPALATPGAAKVKHSIYYRGVHGFGAGFEFAYEPGPVTNLALVTLGEGVWRMVISEGEFLPFPPRPISAPQTLFRHDSLAIGDWCDAWCEAGAPHHMAAARGRWSSHLLQVARILDIDAVVV